MYLHRTGHVTILNDFCLPHGIARTVEDNGSLAQLVDMTGPERDEGE